MNIYLTPQNEEQLRYWHATTDDTTMSGLINDLLQAFFEDDSQTTVRPSESSSKSVSSTDLTYASPKE